jgi:putative glutamine amidotransferase
MRPLILLSCTEITKDCGDPSRQKPHNLRDPDTSDCRRDGLLMSYVRAVAACGGAPLLLPNTADAEATESAVRAAAGLVLTGGADVAAALYGMEPHPTMSGIDPARDQTEKLAIDAAMRLGRPILGICRGIQVLNVVLGGTLIQDIPSHQTANVSERADSRAANVSERANVIEEANHPPIVSDPPVPLRSRLAEPADSPTVAHGNNVTHEIAVEPGSILHQLWGQTSAPVNSSHHQAVLTPAPALQVTARAADGIVEAAQAKDGYPLLAVQFHPERLAHKDPRFAAVFRWLVQAAVQ